MSAADDERRRLSKSYRDLSAGELLQLFEKREALSDVAIDCLRGELRLRGLDPDSLRPTVPKAMSADDDGQGGDASLADDEVSRAEIPALPADGDPEQGAGMDEAYGAGELPAPTEPPGERERGQTMKRRVTDPSIALRPPGTVSTATTGVLGIAGMVVGIYGLLNPAVSRPFAIAAFVSGATSLSVAFALYRAVKKKRDEAAI